MCVYIPKLPWREVSTGHRLHATCINQSRVHGRAGSDPVIWIFLSACSETPESFLGSMDPAFHLRCSINWVISVFTPLWFFWFCDSEVVSWSLFYGEHKNVTFSKSCCLFFPNGGFFIPGACLGSSLCWMQCSGFILYSWGFLVAGSTFSIITTSANSFGKLTTMKTLEGHTHTHTHVVYPWVYLILKGLQLKFDLSMRLPWEFLLGK